MPTSDQEPAEPAPRMGRPPAADRTEVAEVALDPAVARAVDAGLLAVRLPRAFARDLGRAA